MSRAYIYATGECERAEASDLQCLACHCPLVAPLVHVPCGQMTCQTCLATMSSCAHCAQSLLPTALGPVTVTLVLKQLGALKVHCPSCNKVVPRAALEEHVQHCPVDCLRGCGEKVAPAHYTAHDQVCGAVDGPCGAFGCAAVVARRNLQKHRDECFFVKLEPAFRLLEQRLVRQEDGAGRLSQLELITEQLRARLENLEHEPALQHLKQRLAEHLQHLDERLGLLEERLARLEDVRLEDVAGQLVKHDDHEERLAQLENAAAQVIRMDRAEARLAEIERKLGRKGRTAERENMPLASLDILRERRLAQSGASEQAAPPATTDS